MRTPIPTQTMRRTTMPAFLTPGAFQSMAAKPNETEFFCGGSISAPTTSRREGPDSNGPVAPYKVAHGPFQHGSNTAAEAAKALVRRLLGPSPGATKPVSGRRGEAPPKYANERRTATARMGARKQGSRVPWLAALLPTGAAAL